MAKYIGKATAQLKVKVGTQCGICGAGIATGDSFRWIRDDSGRGWTGRACMLHPPGQVGEEVPLPPAPESPPRSPARGGLEGAIEEIVSSVVSQHVDNAIVASASAIANDVENRLTVFRQAVKDELGKAVREVRAASSITIEVHSPKATKKVEGAHKSLPLALRWLSSGTHVYAYGPPGSGKTTAAQQAGEALGLEVGYLQLQPMTPEWRIMGYLTPDGRYVSVEFRRLFEQGGLMIIDEVDNASDSILTQLGSALANGVMSFPDGTVQAHTDFRVMACGNTPGFGPTQAHPGRRALDAATADRFAFIHFDLDTGLEARIVDALIENEPDEIAVELARKWYARALRIRSAMESIAPRVQVSPRGIIRGIRYLLTDPTVDAATLNTMALYRGLDAATIARIEGDVE